MVDEAGGTKNLTLKYEQEIRLAALNQAQQKSQNEMKLKLAEIGLETSIKEGEVAQDVAETNAFTTSLNSDQNTGAQSSMAFGNYAPFTDSLFVGGCDLYQY
ncbi:hypothetical protein P4S72_23610 [Vibrio sp. PP-XX7]